MSRAILLDAGDDVAVLVEPTVAGVPVEIMGVRVDSSLVATASIPMGHKIAVRSLAMGAPIRKQGEVIGRATATVVAGEHVHIHNLASLRG